MPANYVYVAIEIGRSPIAARRRKYDLIADLRRRFDATQLEFVRVYRFRDDWENRRTEIANEAFAD